MQVDLMPWLAAAVITATGAIVALTGARRGHLAGLVAATAGLASAVAGLGWRAWVAGAWPGHRAADALALLAVGALVVLLYLRVPVNRKPTEPQKARDSSPDSVRGQAPASGSSGQSAAVSDPAAHQHPRVGRDIAGGLALFGVTALLAAATLLAWGTPAAAAVWAAGAPLFGLRDALSALGLGGWLIVLAASLPWSLRVLRRRVAAGRPSDDPGRPAAWVSFVWLTAALLAAVGWQLAARVAPWYSAPAALWQFVAWLLGASYLHITSNWRPVRASAWLATLLAGLAFAAASLAALQTASWLL